MNLFLSGALLFFGTHVFSSFRAARAGAVARLGAGGYKALYALLALAGLVLLVVGFQRMEFHPLPWLAPSWGRGAVPLIMLAAAILMVAAYLPGNLKRLVRHPMLISVALWGVAHLLVARHLGALLLFGLFLVYAGYAMLAQGRRGGTPARAWPWYWDLVTVAAGLGFYLVVVWLHGALGRPLF